MAQNAIVDAYTRGMQALENGLNNLKTPHRRVDTSWHDSMVKKANESFLPKPVAKKPPKKTLKKRTAPLNKKRVPRKRSR